MTKESATMSKVLTILEHKKQMACDEIKDNGPESRDNIPVIAERDLLIELKRIFSDKETINLHFNMAIKDSVQNLSISTVPDEPKSEAIAPKFQGIDRLISELVEFRDICVYDWANQAQMDTLNNAVKVLKLVKTYIYE